MKQWFSRILSDKNGNPSECILLILGADLVICILAVVLIMLHHPPTIPEFAGGLSAVHAIGHAGQWANNG